MYYALCRAATYCLVKFRSTGSQNSLQPHTFVEEIEKIIPALTTATTITVLFVALELSSKLRACPSAVEVVC
jgi:hypothetical protein